MKRQKIWVYSPKRPPRLKVPEDVKEEVETKAKELVESSLKPGYIKPPPEDIDINYIVDIYTKWNRSFFYFYAKYASPGPYSISPFFEMGFARMGYVGDGLFDLSFMRHTEQWSEIYQNLPIDECLEAVKNDPYFLL
jgi:hypothetical protein